MIEVITVLIIIWLFLVLGVIALVRPPDKEKTMKKRGTFCPSCKTHYSVYIEKGYPATRHEPSMPDMYSCMHCNMMWTLKEFEEAQEKYYEAAN